MRFRLERRAVFQVDYVDVRSGKPVYTVAAHHTTRDTTLEVFYKRGRHNDIIARIRHREVLPDTIELSGPELPATVPTLSHTGDQYTECIGERVKVKARKYVRKGGRK